jgi:hypothetical protein
MKLRQYLAFLFACVCLTCYSFAQVVPDRTPRPSASVFAQGSFAIVSSNADPSQYGDLLYGGSFGANYQTRTILGFEGRALFLASRSQNDHEEHQRAGFIGPRLATSRGRFGFYAVALPGFSHADYVTRPIVHYPNGQDVLTSDTAAALQIGGGADLRLGHHVSWRIADVTYSKMFATDAPSGAIFSTGLVVRIFH